MSDNNNQPNQSKTGQQDSDFLKRRRVVKGMASIPVILTLGNGAAQANASAHECINEFLAGDEPQCVDRTVGSAPPNTATEWAWDDPESPSGEFKKWCVTYGSEDPLDPENTKQVFYSTVDDNGNVRVVGREQGANPVTASCLTSFA